MCFEAAWAWLRSSLAQTEARFQYRLDKFRARRARKRWLHEELKIARNCSPYDRDFTIYSNYNHLIYQPHNPYMPTTYRTEDDDTPREFSDTEQVTYWNGVCVMFDLERQGWNYWENWFTSALQRWKEYG